MQSCPSINGYCHYHFDLCPTFQELIIQINQIFYIRTRAGAFGSRIVGRADQGEGQGRPPAQRLGVAPLAGGLPDRRWAPEVARCASRAHLSRPNPATEHSASFAWRLASFYVVTTCHKFSGHRRRSGNSRNRFQPRLKVPMVRGCMRHEPRVYFLHSSSIQ